MSRNIFTTAAIIATLFYAPVALAWKPTTHVYLAEQALADAIDDGNITVTRVGGGKIGDYAVDPEILNAIRQFPAHYRAGAFGPDAYPDILTGQQVIHPNTNAGGTNAWLQYLWDAAMQPENRQPQIIAFVVGYLTHAAEDMYGHTFINNFSGGPFEIKPPHGPQNAIKHIVLEGYIDKQLPDPTYDARIDGVEDFIYRYLVNATPGSILDTQLLVRGGEGTSFAVPRRYSTIRARLEASVKDYSDRLADFGRRRDEKLAAAARCKPLNFCSRIALTAQAAGIWAERAAYIAAHGMQKEYKERWIADIDAGLRAWPAVSHEVAKALFFNPGKQADVDRAKAILTQYAIDHLLKMEGSPDVASSIINVIRDIVPDVKFLEELKQQFYSRLVKEATGIDIDELKGYLSDPATYFDVVLNQGAGVPITKQTFHAQYWPQPGAAGFDYRNYPAAYNSVLMSKLLLLKREEVDRLLSDLGSSARLTTANAMLGFISTLDGDNEWIKGMVFASDCAVYSKIFVNQPGEKAPCKPTPVVPMAVILDLLLSDTPPVNKTLPAATMNAILGVLFQ